MFHDLIGIMKYIKMGDLKLMCAWAPEGYAIIIQGSLTKES